MGTVVRRDGQAIRYVHASGTGIPYRSILAERERTESSSDENWNMISEENKQEVRRILGSDEDTWVFSNWLRDCEMFQNFELFSPEVKASLLEKFMKTRLKDIKKESNKFRIGRD